MEHPQTTAYSEWVSKRGGRKGKEEVLFEESSLI